jgi:hypothetical protein
MSHSPFARCEHCPWTCHGTSEVCVREGKQHHEHTGHEVEVDFGLGPTHNSVRYFSARELIARRGASTWTA